MGVIQEVANARTAVVACGHKSVSTRAFVSFPQAAQMSLESYPHCQAVLEVLPGTLRRTGWFSRERTLSTLLNKCRDAEATEPSDKVYSLLGIASDTSHGLLVPDYTLPYKALATQVLRFILQLPDDVFLPGQWTSHDLYRDTVEIKSQLLGSSIRGFPRNLDLMKTLLAKEDVVNHKLAGEPCTDPSVFDRMLLHLPWRGSMPGAYSTPICQHSRRARRNI